MDIAEYAYGAFLSKELRQFNSPKGLNKIAHP